MAGDVKKPHLPAPRWAIRRTHDAVQGTHRAGKPLMWRLRCDGIELPAIPIDTKCVFGVARFRFPSVALPYEYRNGEGKRVKGRQRLLAPGSLLTVVGTHGEDVLVLAPDGTELLIPQSKTDFEVSATPYESKLDSALSDGCRPRGGPGRRGRQRVPIDPCLTTPSSPRHRRRPAQSGGASSHARRVRPTRVCPSCQQQVRPNPLPSGKVRASRSNALPSSSTWAGAHAPPRHPLSPVGRTVGAGSDLRIAAKIFTPKKPSCATVTSGAAVRSSGVKRGASTDLGSAVEATASSNCSSTSATVEAKPTAVPTFSSSFPTLIQQRAKTNHRRKQSPIVLVSTSFNTRVERLETSSFDTLFFVRNCWFALKYALRCIRHLIMLTCLLLPVWGCAMLMSPVWACCVFALFTVWWRVQFFRPNIMLSFILSNLTTVTCIVGLMCGTFVVARFRSASRTTNL
jgi:hypothetical protein